MGKSIKQFNKYSASTKGCGFIRCPHHSGKKRGCPLDACVCMEDRIAAAKRERGARRAYKATKNRERMNDAGCF